MTLSKPPFQFGLKWLFVAMAGVALAIWLATLIPWLVPGLAMLWPLWLFIAWIFWLRRQSTFR